MATQATKSKINRKFIALVLGFALFTAVVLGGIFYWSYAAAPERNIRIGDELIVAAQAAEVAGNTDEAYKKYQEAIGRYGRAVSKKPNNLAYSQKMLDALSLMTPKTSSDAQELYQRREGLLQRRTRSAPLDGEQWMKLLDSMSERAQLFSSSELWQKIVETCDDALGKLPSTDPIAATIQSLRIYARLNQDEVLTAEELATAETAGSEYLKEFPKDERVWASVLHSIAGNSYRLRTANRLSEANARDIEFDRILAQAKVALPNSPRISISELQHLLMLKRLRNPIATPEAINSVLNPLLWQNGDRDSQQFGASATLGGKELIDIADLASVLQDPVVVRRAIQALENYSNRFPNALVEMNAIGKLQKSSEQFDDARKTFERMIAMPAPKVSMLAAFADEIKASALEEIFTIEFGQWENAKTASEKTAALAQAQTVRERLSKVVAGREGELALLRADAKLSYAKRDYLSAVTKLEEIFARQKIVPAELYLLSVICLSERGEQGAALIKINRGIDEYPSVPQFYLVRAGIEAKLGRLMDAKRSVASLLARDPNSVEGQALMAELKKVSGDGAINLSDPVVKIMGDAELIANEGKVDDAVLQIRDAILTYPTDVRLQRTLCQWLLFAGKTKEAQEALAQFLIVNPNDIGLKQLQILSTIPSSVGRVTAFVNEPLADGSPRPADQRAVALAMGLTSLRDSLKQRFQAASEESKPMISAEIAEVTAAAQEALAKAVELAPGDSMLLDRLYAESIADNAPERADQLVVLAEKNCKDPTIAVLLRGRIALDRNNPIKAVEAFEQATAMPGASAAAFRLLGFARERTGDVEGAREAYATSYERRPNDLLTIQLYSSLLARGGKTQLAREVMRAAMLAMPESPAVRNAYYDLESIYGNIANSILERRRMYSVRPSDIENSRQFMKLLIESPVTREVIMNSEGNQKYPPKEWEAMGKERQDQEIQMVARTHAAEATVVYEGLLRANPDDRLSIRTYAAAMQRAGRGIEGEAVLQATAQKATGPNAWQAWVDLGELQLEASKQVEAIASFKRAIELDATETSDATRVISSIWTGRRQPLRSREILAAAFAKHPTLDLARSITALRLETRDFAGAREMSAEVAKLSGGTPTFNDRLLAADIANAELDESFAKATDADTKRILGEFTTAIDDAIRLEPSSALPFVVRASSFQRRFQRTGDPEMSRQAKNDIKRAIELQGNYWPASRLLASILMDEGDIPAATQTVRQFMEQSPRSADARRALIAYQLTAGDYAGGIKTAEDILKLEPKNPIWIQALAEAHIAASQKLDAAKDYEAIFAISRNPEALMQAVLLRVMNKPPDFVGILAAIKLAPNLVNTTPFLQMIGAAALSGTAESDVQKNQGIFQLREMYRLVEPAKGELTDPWLIAVASLFPLDQSGNFEKFEKFVMEACANKPDSSLCRALSQQFIEVGPSGYAKAREYATRAVSSASSEDEKFNALRVMGGIEYKTGNFAAAAAAFEQSLAIRKDDLASINNLAYLEAKYLNKVSQAVERARMSFATNQTNPDLMDTLGYALMKSGEVPEAISLLRRSSRAQPSATVYSHLAEAQLIAGRKDEAAASIERAKALRPDAEAQEQIDEVIKLLDAASRG